MVRELKEKKEKAYLIRSIEEYGKFVAYCIDNDISVWRLHYDDREKAKFCLEIDWKAKRCFYSSLVFYLGKNYKIVLPKFEIDKFGRVELLN